KSDASVTRSHCDDPSILRKRKIENLLLVAVQDAKFLVYYWAIGSIGRGDLGFGAELKDATNDITCDQTTTHESTPVCGLYEILAQFPERNRAVIRSRWTRFHGAASCRLSRFRSRLPSS